MVITEKELNELREQISERMSAERFAHTVGVAYTATLIGKILIPEYVTELECAALLHDIAKELDRNEMVKIAARFDIMLSDEDLASPAIIHSFVGPAVIKSDFSRFATDNILSAVSKHTTGDAEMSLFDEIIFISDYIEPGRSYSSCKNVREYFFSQFSEQKSKEENITLLHMAVLKSIEYTESSLSFRGMCVHSKTKKAKAALLNLI